MALCSAERGVSRLIQRKNVAQLGFCSPFRCLQATNWPLKVAAPNAPISRNTTSSETVEPSLTWPSRTHNCGILRDNDTNITTTICGWVDRHRDLGGLLFLDIRDHTGIVQVVVDPKAQPEVHAIAEGLRSEWVVSITGSVRARSDPNPRIPTGSVEIEASSVAVLNAVRRKLPFTISASADAETPREELRLRHRVLDLRRAAMASNLRLRHNLIKCLRRFLEDEHGFVEVETPILTRSTPEGARDFLVPSRVQAGSWYALPQSPQLFKQMLMVAGLDRYYQIARCFRDEDLRADRQPEFTQLDIEVSWMDADALMSLIEDMVRGAFSAVAGVDVVSQYPSGFPRMTYAEAIEKYSSDRPDLRYGLEMATVKNEVKQCGFRVFSEAAESDKMTVKCMRVPDGGKISNSRLKPKGDVCSEAQAAGAPGLVYARVKDDGVSLEAAKAVCEGLSADHQAAVIAKLDGKPGDLLLFAAGNTAVVLRTLDRVRSYLAKDLQLIPTNAHCLTWITEFPMFEWNEEEGRLEALHHPFTAPNPEDVNEGKDLRHARALAYDLVYNGVEIGGGSLRIYRRDIQEKVFAAIGLNAEEATNKFGYLLESFELGAPPHGGIAFGLDRWAMLLAGATSIRDVIAFPKTTAAQCALTGAPAHVDFAQLTALHVSPLVPADVQ